jgi:hypothetical protein
MELKMEKITRAIWELFTPERKSEFVAAWNGATTAQREAMRDNSELNQSLLLFKGCRVEATDENGETSRFWVGQSTGWIPCTLLIHNTRSMGGDPAYGVYSNIKVIRHSR